MLDAVRRRVTLAQRGRRGRKADVEWINRRRLLRGAERLTAEQRTTLFAKLLTADPAEDIAAAWIAKELLRELLSCARAGWTALRDPRRPGPFLPILCRLQSPRGHQIRAHHRDLASPDHRRPADRPDQRPHRGLQPHRQARRTHRVRLPQPRQPTPPRTVGLHPPITAGHTQPAPMPLLTAKSHKTASSPPTGLSVHQRPGGCGRRRTRGPALSGAERDVLGQPPAGELVVNPENQVAADATSSRPGAGDPRQAQARELTPSTTA